MKPQWKQLPSLGQRQKGVFHILWNDSVILRWEGVPQTYGLRSMASRQSAGTHLSAMTQKSLHGGTPV